MPFTFQPVQIKRHGNELEVRGRVLTGAYYGPEAVVLRSKAGDELVAHIHSHSIEFPEGWPVVPEHRMTVLILEVSAVPPDFEVASLTGIGAVGPARERIDITDALVEPQFWAMQAVLHFTSDDVDDPCLEWLGVHSDDANQWYEARINSHLLAGRWPYIRVSLPSSRYIELELAGGVEYQDRVWIGRESGTKKVLLGYHSGHFSLPALRREEVAWVAAETAFAASNLLWLSATYMDQWVDSQAFTERLARVSPAFCRPRDQL
jgi:hypothetical protein